MFWSWVRSGLLLFLLLAWPGWGNSCGDYLEPTDYFTSFFSRGLSGNQRLQPYAYTSPTNFFRYDDEEEAGNNSEDPLAADWAAYLRISRSAARRLLYETNEAALQQLLRAVADGRGVPAFDTAGQALVRRGGGAAIRYLLLAARSERISAYDVWLEPSVDSSDAARMIAEAEQGWQMSRDPFLRTRYAFQRCKLAFYTGRHADCVRWYDEGLAGAGPSELRNKGLSYKGGSLRALGRKSEAALDFSQVFAWRGRFDPGDYQGFLWSTDGADRRWEKRVLALARNRKEKALVMAAFTLRGVDPELARLKRIYTLDPRSPLLAHIVVREVNKLEENYLTPRMERQRGGQARYYGSHWYRPEAIRPEVQRLQARRLLQFLETAGADVRVPRRSVFVAGAAYVAYLLQDYSKTRRLVRAARRVGPGPRVSDQLRLIDLLVLANDGSRITPQREAEILPALNWLTERAKTDREYEVFHRNFCSEVLAQRYEQQGQGHRAALAYGLADQAFKKEVRNWGYGGSGSDFAANELTTVQLEKLRSVFESRRPSAYERFLIAHSSIDREDVHQMLGTSYLRDRRYDKAIRYLQLVDSLPELSVVRTSHLWFFTEERHPDPFASYTDDTERFDLTRSVPCTQLSLARELLALRRHIDTLRPGEEKARACYRYASALYNTSYYGNLPEAVSGFVSSATWNEGGYTLPWKKEFYQLISARRWFQKAYDLSRDREFRAASLFQIARCAQRQIVRPDYSHHKSDDQWDTYQKKMEAFAVKFQNNKFFPLLTREYADTRFYQQVWNRCSYLRDFVKKGDLSGNRKN